MPGVTIKNEMPDQVGHDGRDVTRNTPYTTGRTFVGLRGG